MNSIDLTGAAWHKSSRSNGQANCVEVGQGGAQVAVRDTQDRTGPALAFSQRGWREFTRRVRDGQPGRLQPHMRDAPPAGGRRGVVLRGP